ncbi:cAMP-dependent protein kinase inhibitor beta isoform X1 [Kogia breviceps]|uniref:cAMP-dependent protein kinase inhibitor beta isoform X1 n=2 Tax=Kogia breviceps TaxID=27615 RepID=UPI0034D30A13
MDAEIRKKDVVMRTDSSKMTDVEPVVNNFASSARTGRRNALPDIQGSAATGGTSELPLKPEVLSVKEAKGYLEESKRIGNTNLYMEEKHIAERSITLLNKWS